MHRSAYRLTALGCAGLLGALAACGSTVPSSGGSGGTLVIGMSQDTSTLNAATATLAEYSFLAYDPLIYKTPAGAFVPDLAASWRYVGTGNRTFELTLRHGVRFSDGSAMTAAAVAASLTYFLKTGSQNVSYAGPVASVSATGADTVRIAYSSPFPDAVDSLCQDFNFGFVIGPKGLADPASLATTTDGAGGYELAPSQTVADSVYTFTKNPYYWNPSALAYSTVQLRPYTTATAEYAALESGQIQYAQNMPISYVKTAASAGYRDTTGAGYWLSLYLEDRAEGPLANPAVRQALEYGVDRAAILAALDDGLGTVMNSAGVPGTPGYDPAEAGRYAYDPAKAKTMLAAAGYPNGFTLTALDVGQLDANGLVAEAVAGQLAKIGVTLKVTVDSGSFTTFNNDLHSRQYASLVWQIKGQGEFTESMQNLLTPGSGTGNIFGTADPAVTSLLTAMADAATTSQLDGYARQLTERLDALAWYVPVAEVDSVELYNPNALKHVAATFQTIDMDPVSPVAGASWTS